MTHMFSRALSCLILAGCAPLAVPPTPPPAPAQEPYYLEYSFGALPGWERAALEPSLRAFLRGCHRLAALARACEAARGVAPGDEPAARAFFEEHFTPYGVIAPEGADVGLVTGYYEPLLEGSRSPGPLHRYPVFGVPEDLIVVDFPEFKHRRLRGRLEGRRLIPYYSRAEISGKREFQAPVIAWTSDPIELFFLQIQGSGQMRLDSGEHIRLGYADQNGHPYRSLGRFLVERGELALDDASMQGIKAWAERNPEKLQEALNHNASYVFFRELPPEDGPIGALGVPLAAGHSLAVDRRFLPLGAPVYLATTQPLSEEPLERLMAAHDTGGAIRGAVRADFFWGSGAAAGEQAGRMRQQGKLWLLWPRGAPLPRGA
ncbi:MAG TPA: MltA domain-containing protein [Burkholderiales bacterium]|nr:MltA domain-containing protein [Burkholderiales bacterium]